MRNQGKSPGKQKANQAQQGRGGGGGVVGAVSKSPTFAQGVKKRACYECGSEAHLVRDCPKVAKVSAVTRKDNEEDDQDEYFRYPAESPEEDSDDDWSPEDEVVATVTRPCGADACPSRSLKRSSPSQNI